MMLFNNRNGGQSLIKRLGDMKEDSECSGEEILSLIFLRMVFVKAQPVSRASPPLASDFLIRLSGACRSRWGSSRLLTWDFSIYLYLFLPFYYSLTILFAKL